MPLTKPPASGATLRGRRIIDFDTGAILTGEKSVEEMGAAMLDLVIASASGASTPIAVALGQDDFLPWKREVSLKAARNERGAEQSSRGL